MTASPTTEFHAFQQRHAGRGFGMHKPLFATVFAAWAAIAAIDYNQSILAFIALLAMTVPQVFIYLNSKRGAVNTQIIVDSTKKIESAMDGAKTAAELKLITMEGKLAASEAKVLALTGEKAAAIATVEEKSRAQEIKTAVEVAKKETP